MQLIERGGRVARRAPFSMLAVALACAVSGTSLAEESDAEESASPVEFGVAYTGEAWRNVRGGLERGGTYLDNLDVTLDVDGEALWDVPGLQLFASALYNNGRSFSGRYVGDAMVVSNIEASRAVRLYELWADWRPGGSPNASLRTGLYDLNSEFDASPTRGLFIHATHGIGQDIAQTGENGPSIFPVTSLAARFAWTPAPDWLLKFAVLDAVPGDPERPSRTTVKLGDGEGALLVAEASFARGPIAQAYVGAWRYTARFDELVRTTPDGTPRSRRDNQGAYAAVDWALTGGGADAGGVSAFVRAGVANDRINEFDRYYAVGIAGDGWLPGDDRIGLALSAARASRDFQQALAGEGVDADRHEYNLELTWRIPVGDYLTLQPDVQYVMNPGVDRSLRNALAIGLRFELAHAWALAPRWRTARR